MARRAQVRIILDEIPYEGNTWVVVVPVDRSYPKRSTGVIRAAAEAMAMFCENIIEQGEIVTEKLIEAENA